MSADIASCLSQGEELPGRTSALTQVNAGGCPPTCWSSRSPASGPTAELCPPPSQTERETVTETPEGSTVASWGEDINDV